MLKIGQIHEVEFTSYSSEGEGVCRIEGCAVFVPNAIRGERCAVKITHVSRSSAHGKIEQILTRSPHRISRACPEAKLCGGCQLHHMDYAEELSFKAQKVTDALNRIGGQSLETVDITGADGTRVQEGSGIEDQATGNGQQATGPVGAVIGPPGASVQSSELSVQSSVGGGAHDAPRFPVGAVIGRPGASVQSSELSVQSSVGGGAYDAPRFPIGAVIGRPGASVQSSELSVQTSVGGGAHDAPRFPVGAVIGRPQEAAVQSSAFRDQSSVGGGAHDAPRFPLGAVIGRPQEAAVQSSAFRDQSSVGGGAHDAPRIPVGAVIGRPQEAAVQSSAFRVQSSELSVQSSVGGGAHDAPRFPVGAVIGRPEETSVQSSELSVQSSEKAFPQGGRWHPATSVPQAACGYRNKAQYPVALKNGKPVAGFYKNRTHEVIPVQRCAILPEVFDKVRDLVIRWAQEDRVSVYDEHTGKGLLRHIYVRRGAVSGQLMVCLVVNGRSLPRENRLVHTLQREIPGLASVQISVNTKNTNVVLGDEFRTLWGKDYIEDTLCGFIFRLSPRSFYQVNHDQAQRLYERAIEFAQLRGRETVLDLYCGTGTITLALSRRAGRVIGVEVVPQAIEDAKQNALRNGVENVEFFCADAKIAAERLCAEGANPDVIVVDPPRKGLAPEVIDAMVTMAPERIVYVSCDPATLARDVKLLTEKGYALTRAEAFDLFPRTFHVETVCCLYHQKNDFISVPYEPKDVEYLKKRI